MDTARLVVLLAASVLVVVGVVAIVARELATKSERRVASPGRDLFEVMGPAVGAIALVALVWRLV